MVLFKSTTFLSHEHCFLPAEQLHWTIGLFMNIQDVFLNIPPHWEVFKEAFVPILSTLQNTSIETSKGKIESYYCISLGIPASTPRRRPPLFAKKNNNNTHQTHPPRCVAQSSSTTLFVGTGMPRSRSATTSSGTRTNAHAASGGQSSRLPPKNADVRSKP